jgi:integrase
VSASPAAARERERTAHPHPREVNAIAAACRPPYDLLVETLAYSGLRIGEALALRRSSVDVLGRRLIVRQSLSDAGGQLTFETPKNHQQRSVNLPAFLVQRLVQHLEERVDVDPHALLFTGRPGSHCATSVFRRASKPAIEVTALHGVTPHDLRATHASWVIDGGGSVLEAAARLGHAAGTVTTRHYARPVAGRDAEVAARLDRWASESGGEGARRGT